MGTSGTASGSQRCSTAVAVLLEELVCGQRCWAGGAVDARFQEREGLTDQRPAECTAISHHSADPRGHQAARRAPVPPGHADFAGPPRPVRRAADGAALALEDGQRVVRLRHGQPQQRGRLPGVLPHADGQAEPGRVGQAGARAPLGAAPPRPPPGSPGPPRSRVHALTPRVARRWWTSRSRRSC